MKTKNIKQEILLFTRTTFSQREWCEKDASNKESFFFSHEQLENACWNGLLSEMFPEIIPLMFREIIPLGKKLFLWQINAGESFLSIELGKQPNPVDRVFSIDPYLFMETINNN